jgi:hypothetical protein
MASQNWWLGISAQSGQLLDGLSSRFVYVDSTSTISLATTGMAADGILENSPPSVGFPATVSWSGLSKITVDNSYAVGTYLVPTGRGIGTQAGALTYQYISAKTFEASDASGQIVSCKIISALPGAAGATGSTGLQGLTGVQGLGMTGVQGLSGVTGVQGLQGNTGVQGQTGLQGVTGVA